MRVNTFRDMEAARRALQTPGIAFIQLNVGESYVHKGIVAFKNYGQAILGIDGGELPDFQEMYSEFIDSLYSRGDLPEGARYEDLRDLTPVDNPFNVMNEVERPFAPGVDTDADPRLTINPSSLKLWSLTYETECHDECPHNWIHHFDVAIYETSKAEAVRMLLSNALGD